MSLLRALRAYVGLGPDEEYEDRYLQDLDRDLEERRGMSRIGLDPDDDAEMAAGSFRSGRGRNGRRPSRADGEPFDDQPSELLDDVGADADAGPGLRSVSGREPARKRSGADGREKKADPGAGSGRGMTIVEPEDDEFIERLLAEEDPEVLEDGDIDLRSADPDGSAAGATVVDGAGDPPDGVDDVLADGVRARPRSTNHAGRSARSKTEQAAAGGGEANVHSLDSMRAKPRTIAPESFADAKLVADEFKRDIPVLLNLQALDRELARRLVDFASGICYVLDGSMEKVASQAFLLIPESVEVSDEDRRRIEERGYAR